MIHQLSKNSLLVRGDIGKGKPATTNLPSIGHRYGKVVQKDAFNAKSLLNYDSAEENENPYKTQTRQSNSLERVLPAKDYPRRFAHIRRSVNLPRKNSTLAVAKQTLKKDASLEEVCHGKRNRPITPIKTLINGEFGNKAEQHFVSKSKEFFLLVSPHLINTLTCGGRNEEIISLPNTCKTQSQRSRLSRRQ